MTFGFHKNETLWSEQCIRNTGSRRLGINMEIRDDNPLRIMLRKL